jgi:DNA-binding NarL/FixJ family response regulator
MRTLGKNMVEGKISVLFAENHTIVRHGLIALLSQFPEFVIVGEADNGLSLLTLAQNLQPDLILTSVVMPQIDGVEATRQIKKLFPGIKIIVISAFHGEHLIRNVIRAGADGFVSKTVTVGELRKVMYSVSAGNKHFPLIDGCEFPPAMIGAGSRNILSRGRPGALKLLSQREHEVLKLIAEGKTHRQITEVLNISINTVNTHRNNIIKKLNLHDTASLVLYAVKNALVNL